MAVLTKEEFMSRISDRLGDDNSDEAIAFMEDMSDTYNDMSTKLNDTTDWKKKYEENDAEWRNKYRERFTSNDDTSHNDDGTEDEPPTPMTYDDLFTTKED